MLLADAILTNRHQFMQPSVQRMIQGKHKLAPDRIYDGVDVAEWEVVKAVADAVEAAPARFVLHSDAASTIHDLMLASPRQMLAALPICRLPFKSLWVEFDYKDRQAYIARLLESGRKIANLDGDIVPKRLGFLLRSGSFEGRDGVFAEVAWDNPLDTHVRSAAGVIFLVTDPVVSGECATDKERADIRRYHEAYPDSYSARYSGPELDASLLLERRIRMAEFQHHVAVSDLAAFRGQKDAHAEQVRYDLSHEWRFVLSLLIALNSRNVIRIGEEVDRTALNRQRTKKGKSPLLSHCEVRLSLSRFHRKQMHGVAESRDLQAHIVRGHWKLRKSGLFWWNPHIRGCEGDPPAQRIYNVVD